MVIFITIASVIAVSLISLVGLLPLLFAKSHPKRLLLALLSLSVGTLLGSVFVHFIPEIIEHGYNLRSAVYILIGFFVFFLIEKFIHSHHAHNLHEGHQHGYHLAPLNLIGDGVHNFIDGMVIAGSYLVSIPLGIAATISVAFHELPQEIADFGILLFSGLSKKKALIFNFLAAGTAILGAIVGLLLGRSTQHFAEFVLPFTVGAFVYIAASNLVPELHREHEILQTLIQIFAALTGVALMIVLTVYGSGH